MTEVVTTPNPADFSINEKHGEYTAIIEVRGCIRISIEADSQENAQRQAEAEMARIEEEGYVEISSIDDIEVQWVAKDRPMYRVTRDGNVMQVSHLQAGDLPRNPDDRGF